MKEEAYGRKRGGLYYLKWEGYGLGEMGGVWLDSGGLCELNGGVRLDERKGRGPYG